MDVGKETTGIRMDKNMYNEEPQGAMPMAWLHRATDEISAQRGTMTMTGYLESSQCYERVRRVDAHQSTIQAGCPAAMATLIFNQYRGTGPSGFMVLMG